jgi:hypothetical protein
VSKPQIWKAHPVPTDLILPPFNANGVSWKVILPFNSIDKFESLETDVVRYFEELFGKLSKDFFGKQTLVVMHNRLTRGKLIELITVPIEKQDRTFEFIDIFVQTSLKNIQIERFVVHDSFVVLYVNGTMTYSTRSRLAHQIRKVFHLPDNELGRLRDLTENKPRKHAPVLMSNNFIPSKQLRASPPFVYCDKVWEFFYNVDNSWDVFKYKIFLKDTLPDYPYRYLDKFLAALPGGYFENGHVFEVRLSGYDPLPIAIFGPCAKVEQAKQLLQPNKMIVVRPNFQTKSEVFQTFIRLFALCAENCLPVFKFIVGGLDSPSKAFIEIHLCHYARRLKAGRIRSAIRARGLIPE